MMLFLRECKAIGKSVVYLIFIIIMLLFIWTQFLVGINDDIKGAEGILNADAAAAGFFSPLLPPNIAEGEDIGNISEEIPDMVMPNAIALLAKEHSINEFKGYPFGFEKITKISQEELDEIEQIIKDVSGLSAEEVMEKVKEGNEAGKIGPFPNTSISQFGEHGDFSTLIPTIIDYDSFKEKMNQVDKMLGGGTSYSIDSLDYFSFRPATSDDLVERYESLVIDDKITNGYARLFCDYMGIVISWLGVFVPVAFLLRDRRAKMNELLYPKEISSFKLIGIRYLSLATMMFVPVLIISCVPLVQFAMFAIKNGIAIDYLAFIKYSFAWLLPTLLVVISVSLIVTLLTDSPLGIVIMFAWGFLTVTSEDLSGLAGKNGFALIIRFNEVGNLPAVQAQMQALIINRISYVVMALLLLAISIVVFELKRKGKLDVWSKLRNNKRKSDLDAA